MIISLGEMKRDGPLTDESFTDVEIHKELIVFDQA